LTNNLGTDGQVKLFDFGLAKCIRKGERADDVFEMTGETGTLRYMAPEVALNMPYNDKAGESPQLKCILTEINFGEGMILGTK